CCMAALGRSLASATSCLPSSWTASAAKPYRVVGCTWFPSMRPTLMGSGSRKCGSPRSPTLRHCSWIESRLRSRKQCRSWTRMDSSDSSSMRYRVFRT
ncbi:MAG: hypothetical protein AVDCRST_MAG29-1571, partial [uncultured Nocardioidaceae bacterium]